MLINPQFLLKRKHQRQLIFCEQVLHFFFSTFKQAILSSSYVGAALSFLFRVLFILLRTLVTLKDNAVMKCRISSKHITFDTSTDWSEF